MALSIYDGPVCSRDGGSILILYADRYFKGLKTS
jgi:hypothetical protein